MSNYAVIISRIIDGGATLPTTPPAQRDFKNTAIVWKGPQKGTQRINYVGNDQTLIMDTYGTNSEALKAARTFLAGGFNGNSPKELFIANIDTATTYPLAAGALTYVAASNAFKVDNSGNAAFWQLLQDNAAKNMLTAVNLTVKSQAINNAYMMITDADQYLVQVFLTKGDYTATPKVPVDFSQAPYSLTNDDATTTGTGFRDSFADAFSEILDDSRVYHLILDNTFTEDEKKTAITLCESSSITHYVWALDVSHDAKYVPQDSDETSLLAWAQNNSYNKCGVVVDDDTPAEPAEGETIAADEYKQASACSYYAQVNWTEASPMGSLMFKSMAGITPSQFADGGVVNTTSAYDNVMAKNGNCYTDFTTVNDACWSKGVAPSGQQIGEIIAKDYVLYQCDYGLFYMLRSQPKLPMTQAGANMIESTMAVALQRLNDAGVIGGGIASDGESFSQNGYKVYAEVPTGTPKAQGLWENVVAKALLTGTTTKITYQIQFKQ